MLLETPFVLPLCSVCKEIWADVCDGSDPSGQTMAWLKGGFSLLSPRSLPVRLQVYMTLQLLSSHCCRVFFFFFYSAPSARGYIRRHCWRGLRQSAWAWRCPDVSSERPQQRQQQHFIAGYSISPRRRLNKQNILYGEEVAADVFQRVSWPVRNRQKEKFKKRKFRFLSFFLFFFFPFFKTRFIMFVGNLYPLNCQHTPARLSAFFFARVMLSCLLRRINSLFTLA